MRVVLDARVASDHFPGIGRVAVELGRALAATNGEDGIEVAFLVPAGPASGRLGALPEPRIPCATSPFAFTQHWSVPRALRRAGADAYHSLYYLTPRTPGLPTLLSCMDLIPLVRPETQPAWKRAIFTACFADAASRAERLVAISESTRRDVCERFGVDPARIDVIPLAADDRFSPAPADAVAALRARLDLTAPFVLYVGSNKPHKNLVRLVEAFRIVAEARPDLRLVVAGVWDPRYEEPRARARDLGLGQRVRFLGPVADADLPALYSAARVFAFPSLYEGFGLPVLEAMRCGAPVVTSATSSLPEVVGDAGITVDPNDAAAIADALARVIDDDGLHDDLARRAVARAGEFTWRRAAAAHRALYRRLLSR